MPNSRWITLFQPQEEGEILLNHPKLYSYILYKLKVQTLVKIFHQKKKKETSDF
jgi:hypothetical protein